jgi:hypothetical protein
VKFSTTELSAISFKKELVESMALSLIIFKC